MLMCWCILSVRARTCKEHTGYWLRCASIRTTDLVCTEHTLLCLLCVCTCLYRAFSLLLLVWSWYPECCH